MAEFNGLDRLFWSEVPEQRDWTLQNPLKSIGPVGVFTQVLADWYIDHDLHCTCLDLVRRKVVPPRYDNRSPNYLYELDLNPMR